MTPLAEEVTGELERSISALLDVSPYSLPPEEHHRALLPVLQQAVRHACDRNSQYANYVRHWPLDFATARNVAELPYLPVSAFKCDPPLSLVPTHEIKRTLSSSSTSGQVPSRVVLDSATSRRMAKAVVAILRDFIGPARRPYLVIDSSEQVAHQSEMGARSVAIQGLSSFATESVRYSASHEDGSIELDALRACCSRWKNASVLVYGFTSILWTEFVLPLKREGICLELPNVHVLHSGGWKKLERIAVSKEEFSREVAAIFGCSEERVIDFYGMVENVGVVYPDCECGHKHVPAFAGVIIRDPLTLLPVSTGGRGLIQVCSSLPTSFPGALLLTDDLGELIGNDGCACGRRGTHFRFVGRVPKVEMRGCGNLETKRRGEKQ